MDQLNKHNISVCARGSLAKGLLTSTSSKRAKLEPYLTYDKKELKSLLSKLEADFNLPLMQLALEFTLMHPAVVSNVVGVSSLTQLIDNLKLNLSKLSESDYEKIKEMTQLKNYLKHTS